MSHSPYPCRHHCRWNSQQQRMRTASLPQMLEGTAFRLRPPDTVPSACPACIFSLQRSLARRREILRSQELRLRLPVVQYVSVSFCCLLVADYESAVRKLKWRSAPSYVINLSLENPLRIIELQAHIPGDPALFSKIKVL